MDGLAEFTAAFSGTPVLIAPSTVRKIFARSDGTTVILHTMPNGHHAGSIVKEDIHVVQLRLNRCDIHATARRFMERARAVCLN